MGIRVETQVVRATLVCAIAAARDPKIPSNPHWQEVTEQIGASPYKTHTTALGTMLLAKATYPEADAHSILSGYGENTISHRSVGHGALAPLSRDPAYRYHPGRLGREPLQNRPYSRHAHMLEINTAHADGQAALDMVIAAGYELNAEPSTALEGLVTWLRVRHEVWLNQPEIDLAGIDVHLSAIVTAADEFLDPHRHDLPARTQAFVAGLFDIAGWGKVGMFGLNDPSRKRPGDVHGYLNNTLTVAAEVRAKAVPESDAVAFIEACARHDPPIPRAAVVVLACQAHTPLPREELARRGREAGVIVTVTEGHQELLDRVFGWATVEIAKKMLDLPEAIARRLEQIDATVESKMAWETLWADAPPLPTNIGIADPPLD